MPVFGSWSAVNQPDIEKCHGDAYNVCSGRDDSRYVLAHDVNMDV
jgi:hypothetical protein